MPQAGQKQKLTLKTFEKRLMALRTSEVIKKKGQDRKFILTLNWYGFREVKESTKM